MPQRRSGESGRKAPAKPKPERDTSWYQITSADEDFFDLERIPVPLLQSVVPVVLRHRDGPILGAGTAFCVATLRGGVALFATARHVVEILAADSTSAEPLVLLPPPELARTEEKGFVGLHVGLVTMMDTCSDVALLAVTLDGTTAQPLGLPLAFGRPRLQELCLGIGFTRLDCGDTVGPDKHLWNYKLHTSRGPIESIHAAGRDQRLPFPSVLIGARFDAGMSGGPILDGNGRVIAVISSGTHTSAELPPTSYGALTATLAELGLKLVDDTGTPRAFDFGELCGRGFVTGDGAVFSLSRSDNGLRVDWRDPHADSET